MAASRRDAVYCRKACRQAAFRLRRRRVAEASEQGDLAFIYADPPYPGLARRYYGREESYGGEVDHRWLIESLEAFRIGGAVAGWALSTSSKALRDVLPLCPSAARVCPWVKPIGASPRTAGLHNTWEPLIVVPGRHLRPGKRDWLAAKPARGGGSLMGRKPIAFCAFLFDALGMLPGDVLFDVFPGTGVVGRAWSAFSSRAALGDVSPSARADTSQEYFDDASVPAPGDASPAAARDAFSVAGHLGGRAA